MILSKQLYITTINGTTIDLLFLVLPELNLSSSAWYLDGGLFGLEEGVNLHPPLPIFLEN